jgi:hypothetical protein
MKFCPGPSQRASRMACIHEVVQTVPGRRRGDSQRHADPPVRVRHWRSPVDRARSTDQADLVRAGADDRSRRATTSASHRCLQETPPCRLCAAGNCADGGRGGTQINQPAAGGRVSSDWLGKSWACPRAGNRHWPARPQRGRIDQGSTMNGSIMSLSSCSTMWQWWTYFWGAVTPSGRSNFARMVVK